MPQTIQVQETDNNEPELELEVTTSETSDTEAGEQTTDDQSKTELADLRKQLEEANRKAQDAEARASALDAEKNTANTQLVSEINTRFAAQEQAIDARLNKAKSDLVNAKAEMVRAQTEGRFDAAADLAEQIADAKQDERAATWEKNRIAQLKTQAASEMEARATAAQDPTESFLSTIPGAQSKQWLRNHPDVLQKVVNDPRERSRLFGAAQLAQADGHVPDSAQYFDAIEKTLKLKEADPVVVDTQKPAARQAGKTASAAPSTRSTPSSDNSPRVVQLKDVVRKLTANDLANAKISFPDKKPEEAAELYAQGLVLSKQREPNFRPDIRL